MKKLFALIFCGMFAFFGLTAQDTATQKNNVKERPGAQLVPPATVYAQEPAKLPAAPSSSLTKGASDETPVPVDYSNPDSFYDQGFIGLLKAGVLAIIAALGAFLPGLRTVATSAKGGKIISSAVVTFVALTAVIAFRQGAFTENLFNMITQEFLPNFGYMGLIYSAYTFVVNLVKKKLPTAPAATE